MRIWSIHPKYLDTKGLVALWRESLLAKHVLAGQTKGYKYHPQLNRFKTQEKPIDLINQYLSEVYKEAIARNFNFNKSKVDWNFSPGQLYVTTGQVEFETQHLLIKLKKRDNPYYDKIRYTKNWIPHPLFKIVKGQIESWEIT